MHRQTIGRGAKIGVVLTVSAVIFFTGLGCEERQSAFPILIAHNEPQTNVNHSPLDSVAILEKVAVAQSLETINKNNTGFDSVGPTDGAVSFSSEDVIRFTPDPLDIGLTDIARSIQVKLSLQEAVAKALANNFRIQTEGYGPAISATEILSAEAVFDAVYFLEAGFQKLDRPTGTLGVSGQSETQTLNTGLRKAMPTGALLSGTYNLTRQDPSPYATQPPIIDPAYTNSFMLELRQPLLQGFGLDVNRAGIEVARNNQRISKYRYRTTVRDTLAEVEQAYWRLVQARRNVVIQEELIRQTKETYDFLELRKDFDVYNVQISRVAALLATRRAEYVQVKNIVRDAEDQLKVLLNDPDLNLGEDTEIIPTDFPTLGPLIVDRISEVQSALQCRSEIQEAKLLIENRRINVAVTRNRALPRFDLVFQYTIHGLSDNPGNAFDQMTTSNYQDYFVGMSFEYPIGNRGPRAQQRRATLERDQSIAALKQVIEGVIFEVDRAVRNLQTSYHQVSPSTEAVLASEENLTAIVARQVRLSPEFLEVRLNAQETLANARRGLLAALVNYNIAIVELERAKDTLLFYNNVNIEAQ